MSLFKFLCLVLIAQFAYSDVSLFGDVFNTADLDSGWTVSDGYAINNPSDVVNHASYQLLEGHLEVSFPGGEEHNQWRFEHAALLRDYEGSGVYEIKMDSQMTGDQQFGLVFQTASDRFIMFMFMFYGSSPVYAYIERFSSQNGQYLVRQTIPGADLGDSALEPGSYYMRVTVSDNQDPALRNWHWEWSRNGDDWRVLWNGVVEDSDSVRHNIGEIQQVGIFAGNQIFGKDAFNAQFDYFETYPDPGVAVVISESPSSLLVSADDSQVSLSWESSGIVDGYRVYRSEVSGGSYSQIADTTFTEIVDTNVVNETPYYYAVTAYNVDGESGLSTEVIATPSRVALGIPDLVEVTADDTTVALSWGAVAGVEGYRVYRSESSGVGYDLVADVASVQFIDADVVRDATYYYAVSSYDAVEESEFSEEVSVSFAGSSLDSPGAITVAGGDGESIIQWDTVTGADGYRVYRSESSGGNYALIADVTATGFTDTDVLNDTSYYYVVTAYDAYEETVYSEETTVLPVSLPANGLVLSISGSDASLSYADGDFISVWQDASCLSHSAVVGGGDPTFVSSAINGHPAIHLDGSGDYLQILTVASDYTEGMTMYIVARPTDYQRASKLLCMGNGANQDDICIGRNGSGRGLQYFTNNDSGDVQWFSTADALIEGEAALYSVTQGAAGVGSSVSAEISRNGEVVGAGSVYVQGVVARDVNYIVRGYWSEDLFEGDIAEVLIYNRDLNESEQAVVEEYLNSKYGL